MQGLMQNWIQFGGNAWTYNASERTVKNTSNSNYFTGYYYAEKDDNGITVPGDFDDIEFTFDAKTTDSDDDIIGAMVRFSGNTSTGYTGYLFVLDRHDTSGKGINNGAYNGLNKIINQKIHNTGSPQTLLTKMDVNPSIIWERSVYTTYKVTVKNKTITAYINGLKKFEIEDNGQFRYKNVDSNALLPPIESGSFGFLTFSQNNTNFYKIKIIAIKYNSLGSILDRVDWDSTATNFVVNYNNYTDELLTNDSLKNSFEENNIYYIGAGSETNRDQINSFISSIGGHGTYIENNDSAIDNIYSYIKPHIPVIH